MKKEAVKLTLISDLEAALQNTIIVCFDDKIWPSGK